MNQLRTWIRLFEAPLADFGVFGGNEEGGLRTADLRAAANPKWQLRVRNAFDHTPYKFNVYLYNAPGGQFNIMPGSKWAAEHVDVRDLRNNLDRYAGIQPLDFVASTIGKLPPDAADSITIMLVENEGAERVPLTPWILAHRIAHVFFYAGEAGPRTDPEVAKRVRIITDNFGDLLRDVRRILSSVRGRYEYSANEIAKQIATFRSGRLGNLANPGEFMVEMCVQYLIQGQIRFNHPVLDTYGRTEVAGEERELLKAARRFAGIRTREFVDFIMMNDPTYRPFYAMIKKRPQTVWTLYNSAGQVIMTMTDPDEVKRYESNLSRGFRVVEKKPSRAAMAKWQPFLDREAQLESMYKRWSEKGMLRPTATDRLDDVLDAKRDAFQRQINHILQACVGKALVF